MQLMKRGTKPVAEYAPTFKKICDQLLPLLESLSESYSYNRLVALAEWLRRVPAKYMGFPRESKNLSGDENFFFGKFPNYYKECFVLLYGDNKIHFV